MQEAAAKAALINDREFFGVLRECFGFLIAMINMAFAPKPSKGEEQTCSVHFFNDGEMAF